MSSIAQNFDQVRATAKVGSPGQCIAHTVKRTDTVLNASPAVAKVYDFEVDTSTAGLTYEFSINDTPISVVATTSTDAEVAAELLAAAEAEPLAGAVATFSIVDGSGTDDVLRVTGRVPGNDFEASTADGKLAGSEDTAAASSAPIALGKPVYISAYDDEGKKGALMDANQAGELAAFAGITAIISSIEGTEYPGGEAMLVLQQGEVWVAVDGTPTYGGTVYADAAGNFYAAAGAGRAALPTTAAKWLRGADGLGLLSVNA